MVPHSQFILFSFLFSLLFITTAGEWTPGASSITNYQAYKVQDYNAHKPLKDTFISKKDREKAAQNALSNAWADYGPKSKIHPDKLYERFENYAVDYSPGVWQNFQPMESEWDHHLTVNKKSTPYWNRKVTEPGIFHHILVQYIDFEVNHHEVADFARRTVFAFFVGILIVGWVALGLYIGLFPLSWLAIFTGRSFSAEKNKEKNKLVTRRNDENSILQEFTDKISLSLEENWLDQLEKRIKLSSEEKKWVKTHVQCCILPEPKTKGMAECEIVRKARKMNTFKCLSDLVYRFQFASTSEDKTNSDKNKQN